MFFLLKADPYQVDVAFAIEETEDRIHRYLRQQLKCKPSLIDSMKESDAGKKNWDGNCIQFDNGALLIRIKKRVINPATIGLLGHEVIHAVGYILRGRGIPFNDDTEEAYTYLHQELMTKALRKCAKQWWK